MIRLLEPGASGYGPTGVKIVRVDTRLGKEHFVHWKFAWTLAGLSSFAKWFVGLAGLKCACTKAIF